MKNSKMILTTLALGAVATTGFVAPAFAASTTGTTSNATIKAVAGGDTPVSPVDPENPKDPSKPGPTDPDDGNTTNQTGSLQINYVSHLNFGDNVAITPTTVTANVKNETPRFFQVSDLRGTGAGWKLNVSLSNFKPTDSNSKAGAITGAAISFSGGEAVTSNTSDDNAVTVNDFTLNAGTTSGVSTMMTAKEGTGRGTWLARYTAKSGASDNEKVVFTAPAENINADTSYQATLTWQLADTPQ